MLLIFVVIYCVYGQSNSFLATEYTPYQAVYGTVEVIATDGGAVSASGLQSKTSIFPFNFGNSWTSIPKTTYWMIGINNVQQYPSVYAQSVILTIDYSTTTLTSENIQLYVEENCGTMIQGFHVQYLITTNPQIYVKYVEATTGTNGAYSYGPFLDEPIVAFFMTSFQGYSDIQSSYRWRATPSYFTLAMDQNSFYLSIIGMSVVVINREPYDTAEGNTRLIDAYQYILELEDSQLFSPTFRPILKQAADQQCAQALHGVVYYNRTVSPEFNFFVETRSKCTNTPTYLCRRYSSANYYRHFTYQNVMMYEGICQNAIAVVIDGRIYCVCAPGRYAQESSCIVCPDTCDSCIQGSCLTCKPNMIINTNDGNCYCDTGFYNINSTACGSCHSSCQTCNGPLNSNCLACPYPQINQGGYCVNCPTSCQTCDQNGCTSCPSTRNQMEQYNFQTGQYYLDCICKQGTFDVQQKDCISCSRGCLACDQSTCYECDPSRIMIQAQCFCQTGYFDSPLSGQCNSCLKGCSSCTSSDDCFGCIVETGRSLSTVTNKCVCNAYSYDDPQSNGCLPCFNGCYSCLNPVSCTACNINDHRVLQGGKCTCDTGYFEQEFTQTICGTCNYTCRTCSSVNICLTCPTNTNRTLNTANASCPCSTRYYDSGVAQCQPCYYSCFKCSNESSCDECSATVDFRVMNTTSKVCQCLPGYVENLPSSVCFTCPYTCYSCTAGGQCLSCFSNSFRQFNSTDQTCRCPVRYFEIANVSTCGICRRGCYTCNNTRTCDSCLASDFRTLINGTCRCNDGYFDDSLNFACQQCDASCLTCRSKLQCILCPPQSFRTFDVFSLKCTCDARYFDLGYRQCSACFYSCYKCTNSFFCDSCSFEVDHRIQNTNTKNCICSQGYYDDGVNPICKACNIECLECLGSQDNCVSCSSKAFRIQLGTNCPCQVRYYEAGFSYCRQCHYSCYTCTTPDRCVNCASSDFRTQDSNTGLCVCNQGYYDNGQNVCLKCHYSCLTCANGTACSTCANPRTLNVTTLLCDCQPRFFDQGVLLCQPCKPSCLSCVSEQLCTACSDSDYRVYNPQKQSCLCAQGYYDDLISQQCQSCSIFCKTCSSDSKCLSCSDDTNRILTVNSTCACNIRYYDTGSSPICGQCDYPCLTCARGLPKQCLSCLNSDNRYLKNSQCLCVNGTYDDGSMSTCQSCLYSCQTCLNNKTCTSCNSVAQRTLESGQCICNERYFDIGYAQCLPCYYTCLTCKRPESCQSCQTLDFRQLQNLSCVCQTGYYDDGRNATCQKCHYSCFQCSSATSCLSCPSSANRLYSLNASTCPCAPRYFEPSIGTLICQECQYSCWTCNNNKTCLSCNPNDFRGLDPSTKRCKCYATYSDDGENPLCITSAVTTVSSVCNYTCFQCLDPNTCVQCMPGSNRYFDSWSNNCPCLDGYYEAENKICPKCRYDCQTCTNNTVCLTCDNSAFRTQVGNFCICSTSGFYDDGKSAQCQSCPSTCFECKSFSECTSCLDINFRLLKDKKCECYPRFFDGGKDTCTPCYYTCQLCSDSFSCDYCDPSSNRELIKVDCNCKKGYFDDGHSQICKQCPQQCTQCQDTFTCTDCDVLRVLTNGQCKCQERYYEDSKLKCLPCSHQCLNCVNEQKCIECSEDDLRYLNEDSCSCMPGYYDDGTSQKCQQCHYSCNLCSFYQSCQNCVAGMNRKYENQQCPCNSGFYDDGHADCKNCFYTCLSCTNQKECTQCALEHNRYLVGSDCKCKDGYYDDGNNVACKKCGVNCLTCLYSTSCQTCNLQDMRSLDPINMLCNCQRGYYDQGQSRCQKCNYPCITCDSSPDNCTECPLNNDLINNTCYCSDGYKYNDTTQLCERFCGDGYFLSENLLCVKCSTKCQNCISGSSCTSCDINAHRQLQNQSCLCQPTYYDDGINTICQECHFSCRLCTSPSQYTCQACNGNRILKDQQCLCPVGYFASQNSPTCSSRCQNGYYLSQNDQCQLCHEACTTCDGPLYTDCLSCTQQPALTPIISIQQSSYYVSDYFSATAQVFNLKCINKKIQSFDIQYSPSAAWELYQLTSQSKLQIMNQSETYENISTFNIPPLTLVPDTNYQLIFKVNETFTTQKSFSTKRRPPFVYIRGGNKTININEEAILEAKIFDLDTAEFTDDDNVLFSWSCFVVDKSCDLYARTNTSTYNIKPGQIGPFEQASISLQITINDDYRQLECYLLYTEDIIPKVEIEINPFILYQGLNLNQKVFVNFSEIKDSPQIEQHEQKIQVFQDGETYYSMNFIGSLGHFTLTNPSINTSKPVQVLGFYYFQKFTQVQIQSIEIQMNPPPQNCKLYVDKDQGQELETIFNIAVDSCFDTNLPLLYQFKYHVKEDILVSLNDFDHPSSLSTILTSNKIDEPLHELTIIVRVMNTVGAISELIQTIKLNAIQVDSIVPENILSKWDSLSDIHQSILYGLLISIKIQKITNVSEITQMKLDVLKRLDNIPESKQSSFYVNQINEAKVNIITSDDFSLDEIDVVQLSSQISDSLEMIIEGKLKLYQQSMLLGTTSRIQQQQEIFYKTLNQNRQAANHILKQGINDQNDQITLSSLNQIDSFAKALLIGEVQGYTQSIDFGDYSIGFGLLNSNLFDKQQQVAVYQRNSLRVLQRSSSFAYIETRYDYNPMRHVAEFPYTSQDYPSAKYSLMYFEGQAFAPSNFSQIQSDKIYQLKFNISTYIQRIDRSVCLHYLNEWSNTTCQTVRYNFSVVCSCNQSGYVTVVDDYLYIYQASGVAAVLTKRGIALIVLFTLFSCFYFFSFIKSLLSKEKMTIEFIRQSVPPQEKKELKIENKEKLQEPKDQQQDKDQEIVELSPISPDNLASQELDVRDNYLYDDFDELQCWEFMMRSHSTLRALRQSYDQVPHSERLLMVYNGHLIGLAAAIIFGTDISEGVVIGVSIISSIITQLYKQLVLELLVRRTKVSFQLAIGLLIGMFALLFILCVYFVCLPLSIEELNYIAANYVIAITFDSLIVELSIRALQYWREKKKYNYM